jgi:hypothetical protein
LYATIVSSDPAFDDRSRSHANPPATKIPRRWRRKKFRHLAFDCLLGRSEVVEVNGVPWTILHARNFADPQFLIGVREITTRSKCDETGNADISAQQHPIGAILLPDEKCLSHEMPLHTTPF